MTKRKNSPDLQGFAPYWNDRARWLLFYIIPAVLLIGELTVIGWRANSGAALWRLPGIGWSAINPRDFWAPLLWGLWMPWFNGVRTPVPGLKLIVFRDFNDNEQLALAVPLLHAVFWVAYSQLPVPIYVQAFLFGATWLTYDILLLRYDLLQLYWPDFARDIGAKHVLKSFLPKWWIYVSTTLALIHTYVSDAPLAILGSVALFIVPMQLFLFRYRRRPKKVKAENVAVIGAGWSGTYAAKWLMQAGLDVQVYERSDHIGGLWHYDEDSPGGVAESTFASSSNYYMHASDYPMRTVGFPKHREIYDFINSYADTFGVREKVSFRSEIQSVEKQDGHWVVRGTRDGVAFEETFDAVVVASGVNEQPQDFDARYDGFAGELMHSSRYKHTGSVGEHRRIVVVGLGESAADIAHECAQLRNAEVYMSGTTGWFAGRIVGGGLPADLLMAPGIRTLMAPFFTFEHIGRKIVNMLISFTWGRRGSSVKMWASPAPWLHAFVTKSYAAVQDIHEGRITPHRQIVRCEGNTVEFEDGSTVEADLIIDCTGFAPTFPFLPRNYGHHEQYRLVFNREDPTLSFVGSARPVLGSIPALAEMQARWIASVYSGRARLPSRGEQKRDTFFARRMHRRRFYMSEKRPNLVDHEFYAQAIARDIGVTVPWWQVLLRSPGKFYMLLWAPWTAFKYELRGRNRRAAMAHIREHMPRSPVYSGLVKSRFLRLGYIMWILKGAWYTFLALSVPPFILATVGAGLAVEYAARTIQGARARVE